MELMNASFDEKKRELTTLALGRGIGDCGIQTRWRFNGQRFRLVRYAEEPSCDNWNGPDAAHAVDHKVGFCRFVGRVRRSRHPATQIALQHAQRLLHYVLNGKAEVREQLIGRGGFTVTLHADNRPFQTHIFVPVVGNASFNRHARRDV